MPLGKMLLLLFSSGSVSLESEAFQGTTRQVKQWQFSGNGALKELQSCPAFSSICQAASFHCGCGYCFSRLPPNCGEGYWPERNRLPNISLAKMIFFQNQQRIAIQGLQPCAGSSCWGTLWCLGTKTPYSGLPALFNWGFCLIGFFTFSTFWSKFVSKSIADQESSFCPSVSGRTLLGHSVSCQRGRTQAGDLLRSHLSKKRGRRGNPQAFYWVCMLIRS